jgi:hypothetical protein
MICSSELLPHIRLDAVAPIYQTINSEQFSEAWSLILTIDLAMAAEKTGKWRQSYNRRSVFVIRSADMMAIP